MRSSSEQLKLFEDSKRIPRPSSDRIGEVEKTAIKMARLSGFEVKSIRWKNNRRVMASVGKDGVLNLHTIYQQADRDDLAALVNVMSGKTREDDRRRFLGYVEKYLPSELDEVVSRLVILPPKGLFHDLDKALRVVLPLLEKPIKKMPKVGWSPVRVGIRGITWGTHREMPKGNLILVNAVLDASDIPPYVVEHIVWHEICHEVLQPENGSNGRRRVHSTTFREMEHRYPKARQAEKWELNNVAMLIRRHRNRRGRRRRTH